MVVFNSLVLSSIMHKLLRCGDLGLKDLLPFSRVVSPLAMLYSTSVMEHHHFDHSIMILNSEVIKNQVVDYKGSRVKII